MLFPRLKNPYIDTPFAGYNNVSVPVIVDITGFYGRSNNHYL